MPTTWWQWVISVAGLGWIGFCLVGLVVSLVRLFTRNPTDEEPAFEGEWEEEWEESSSVGDPTLSGRDANALILQGMPYQWVSTAIGGATPLQMIRAMQADGISELEALVQTCETGFDAFCRSLADTANVKGAPDYYKGRERDLYKTELLKVLTEHYGLARAEQAIDRLSNL